MADLSDIKPRKPKVSVSLSLDKENIDFLKGEIDKINEQENMGLTLSSVFDYLLDNFVNKLKEESENGEEKAL